MKDLLIVCKRIVKSALFVNKHTLWTTNSYHISSRFLLNSTRQAMDSPGSDSSLLRLIDDSSSEVGCDEEPGVLVTRN